MIPISVVARKPRHLVAKNDPDMPQRDFGNQLFEPAPVLAMLTGKTQIGINDANPFACPTEQLSSLDELVLVDLALPVAFHLFEGGLPYIDASQPFPMVFRQFGLPRSHGSVRRLNRFSHALLPPGG